MADDIFLQLSPEFGSTKFGPFTGVEIRLGSDPTRNDITLPENLGVLPEHVKILKQANSSFIVAPTERTAGVFIWRQDGRTPKQITTPMAVGAGDGFSLVTAEGPRFYIVVEESVASKKAKEEEAKAKGGLGNKAKNALSAQSWKEQLQHMGMAKFAQTKFGAAFGNARTFITSGAIFQPRNIIMLAGLAMSGVFVGGLGCTTIGLFSQNRGLNSQLAAAKRECGGEPGGDEDLGPNGYNLTQKILKDESWFGTLREDKKLRGAYAEKLGSLLKGKPDKWAWVFNKSSGTSYADWAKVVLNQFSGNDQAVGRVLAYTAALPTPGGVTDYFMLSQDSEGGRACGRGPAAITYWQAKNLGITPLQVDALVKGDIAASNDTEEMRRALLATDSAFTFEDDQIGEPSTVGGGFSCLFLEGDDNRKEIKDTVKQLKSELGSGKKGLPSAGDNYWVAARLFRFYAADFRVGFGDLVFDERMPTAVLDDNTVLNDNQKKYVLESSADVMARAVAIPCMAVLAKSEKFDHLAVEKPTLVDCLLVSGLVGYDQLF